MKRTPSPLVLAVLAWGAMGGLHAQPTPTPTPLADGGFQLPSAPQVEAVPADPAEPFAFRAEAPQISTPFGAAEKGFASAVREDFVSPAAVLEVSDRPAPRPAPAPGPAFTPTASSTAAPSELAGLPLATSTQAQNTVNTAPAATRNLLSSVPDAPRAAAALAFFSSNSSDSTLATATPRQILSPNTRGKIGGLFVNDTLTLQAGGIYYFDFLDTQSPQRTDRITATRVSIAATADNPFVIHLGTYNQAGLNTALSDLRFNPAYSYRWDILDAGSIAGFSPELFAIDDSDFVNNQNGGFFSIDQVGNRLVLDFTPVPEPSTWALLGLGSVLAALLRFRSRRH